MRPKPKYSVIIPVRNGMPYLRYALLSVLESDCAGVEVIVSLDGSNDGAEEFLLEIEDARLKVVRPDKKLSMSEHWDFAQLQATGDWQLFLGQDDMLMSGYGDAFENLTQTAMDRGLEIIVARRAYIAWPPLGDAKLKALQYWESAELETKQAETFTSKALLSGISYHAGPQMYTTTLVSEKLVSAIRQNQGGRLVLGHPQDAYIAAALLKEGRSFLFSGRPFSWVGSSIKSAGLAIASRGDGGESDSLANEYFSSVTNSDGLSYLSSVDFRHAVNSRYFLDALSVVWPKIFETKHFKTALFRILVDSHSWSVLAQNRKNGIALKEIFFFPRFNFVKVVFGFIWITKANGLSLVHRIGGRVLRAINLGNTKFMSSNHVADPEELFELSRSVRASY
jgi:glycosyltransferase involved in cell wall biosynthesis